MQTGKNTGKKITLNSSWRQWTQPDGSFLHKLIQQFYMTIKSSPWFFPCFLSSYIASTKGFHLTLLLSQQILQMSFLFFSLTTFSSETQMIHSDNFPWNQMAFLSQWVVPSPSGSQKISLKLLEIEFWAAYTTGSAKYSICFTLVDLTRAITSIINDGLNLLRRHSLILLL